MSMARARSASSPPSRRRFARAAIACASLPRGRSSLASSASPGTISNRCCARARAMTRSATKSPPSGSGVTTVIPRSAPPRRQSSAKSRCPTSVADYKPQLTNAARPATFEVEAYNERGEMVPTSIAGEHPLTLYVDKREIVTLMTLGHAPEALVIGYLRNQRLVKSIEQIAEVQVDWETDAVAITTRTPISGLDARMEKRTVTTGCGQGTVFGDLMDEVDTIRLRDDVRLDEATLYELLDAVRRHETIYKSAGAVHG